MATFTFKWPHDAEEVYVTGTFDNWSKSEQLEKVGNGFEKTVKLPDASEKILYKFVVDGNWTTDHTAPQEKDQEGNENNVLFPKDMSTVDESGPAAAIINSVAPESTTAQLAGAVPPEAKEEKGDFAAAVLNTVTPESTTAQLAGAVPLEETKEDTNSGAINTVTPESTTARLAGSVPLEEKKDISAPGAYPETPATELDKEIKINPLPAANGAVNPIHLAPGEKIPDEVTAGNVSDNVTLDKESYEKGDRLPGLEAEPAPVVIGKIEPEFGVKPLPATEGALNPITLAPGEKIPDEVKAGSTTDNVTLDKESYEKADRLPGLDTEPTPVVIGKIEPEFGVKPLPATEGALNPIQLAPGEKIPDTVTAGSTTDNVTLDKESYEKADRLPGLDAEPAPVVGGTIEPEFSVKPLPATEGALNPIHLAPGEKIPESVVAGSTTDNVTLDKESYEKSDRIPGIDSELPPVVAGNIIPESSLPIVSASDAAINTVTPEATTAALAGKVPLEEPKVPEVVKKSQEEAHVDPEASGIAEEVKEKAEVEEELLKKVPEVPSTSEGTAGKGTEKSETDKTLTESAAIFAASATTAVLGAAAAAQHSASAAVADVASKLPDSIKDALPTSLQPQVAAEPPKLPDVAAGVPLQVKESIETAGESAEAAANPVAIEEKKEVESQILKEIKTIKPVEETPAPETPKVEEAKAEEPAVEAKPKVEEPAAEPAAPVEASTNGVKAAAPEPVAAAPVTTSTEAPADVTKPADATATAEKKKRNRLSAFFSKIKHKVTDRDHK